MTMKNNIESRLLAVWSSLRSASDQPKKSVTVRQELKSELDEFSKKVAKHFSLIVRKYNTDMPTQIILLEYLVKRIKQHL